MPSPRSPGGPETAGEALRDTLFGDMPLDEWPREGAPADVFPWSAFAEARAHLAGGAVEQAKDCWRAVIAEPALESRQYLQAWHFLREHGEHPPEAIARQVLGFVTEMGLPEGLDLLAVYADRSARYFNHAGGGIVAERGEGRLAELIDALLAASAEVVSQIGPWLEARRGAPGRGDARLSVLTPGGLHFGEGPIEVLEQDPLGGLVLPRATAVMAELVAMRV